MSPSPFFCPSSPYSSVPQNSVDTQAWQTHLQELVEGRVLSLMTEARSLWKRYFHNGWTLVVIVDATRGVVPGSAAFRIISYAILPSELWMAAIEIHRYEPPTCSRFSPCLPHNEQDDMKTWRFCLPCLWSRPGYRPTHPTWQKGHIDQCEL